MAKKRRTNYFQMFVEMVEFSCSASRNLSKTLINFEVDKLPEIMDYIHTIEHSADDKKHELMVKLADEFITPIEREDIMSLAQTIDDVTDAIEDVLMRAYMFNIQSIRSEALDFADVIIQCCDCLKKTMEEFHNFQKSTAIHQLIVDVNHLEEDGDRIYKEAMRNLYVNSKDPVEILAWSEMFDRLEKCCDACEHVTDIVESVILKNT